MVDQYSNTMDQDLEKLLKELECPFTWSMNDVIGKTIGRETSLYDDEELIPILKIFKVLMKIFLDLQKRKKNTNDGEDPTEDIITSAEKLDGLVLETVE